MPRPGVSGCLFPMLPVGTGKLSRTVCMLRLSCVSSQISRDAQPWPSWRLAAGPCLPETEVPLLSHQHQHLVCPPRRCDGYKLLVRENEEGITAGTITSTKNEVLLKNYLITVNVFWFPPWSSQYLSEGLFQVAWCIDHFHRYKAQKLQSEDRVAVSRVDTAGRWSPLPGTQEAA